MTSNIKMMLRCARVLWYGGTTHRCSSQPNTTQMPQAYAHHARTTNIETTLPHTRAHRHGITIHLCNPQQDAIRTANAKMTLQCARTLRHGATAHRCNLRNGAPHSLQTQTPHQRSQHHDDAAIYICTPTRRYYSRAWFSTRCHHRRCSSNTTPKQTPPS